MRLPALLHRAAVVAGLSAWCLCVRAQQADAPVQEPETAPEVEQETAQPLTAAPSPADQLAAAVKAYQASRPDDAQALLAGLVNNENYKNNEIRQEARVYLGEVLYRRDDQEAARRIFERVLTEDPGYRIDPFRHPPDVCGFFETIRAYIRPPPAEAPPPARPLPSIGYVGFGLYQIRHDREGIGVVMLTTQTIAGILSAATFASLLDGRVYPAGAFDQASALRTVQWSSTSVFWGTWIWSVLDAGSHWRAQATPAPADSPTPTLLPPPGMQLQVSGRLR